MPVAKEFADPLTREELEELAIAVYGGDLKFMLKSLQASLSRAKKQAKLNRSMWARVLERDIPLLKKMARYG